MDEKPTVTIINTESLNYGERLRDQFAMAALPGVMAREGGVFSEWQVAQQCYFIADEMIRERANSQSG